MKKPGSMGLNILLLLTMVTTNILSLYHLLSLSPSSPPSSSSSSSSPSLPPHLLHQLHTIHSTISHLTSQLPSQSPSSPPPELLLLSSFSPIPSSCSLHPLLLHSFMNYTPFSPCPPHSLLAAEPLILLGCHPLPRRRCFSPTIPKFTSKSINDGPTSFLSDSAVLWPSSSHCRSFSCLPPALGFHPKTESTRFITSKSALDLSLPQLISLSRTANAAPIRLGIDIAGGTGTLAVQMRRLANATIVTTTLNGGMPYSEVAASRGVVPLHVPLQQRLPIQDGVMDLVRTGRAVNRWIPLPVLEFLVYDVDRVLRGGGLFWVDHFFCKNTDLGKVYEPVFTRLGYKKIKWAVAAKDDAGGVKNGEVYLTALLQKPVSRTVVAGSKL